MKFIFNKEKLKDMHDVISLYLKFDRYKRYSRVQIYSHLLPCFILNQYKIHKDNDNNMIAFTNWAYLDKETEDRFTRTGIIKQKDWKSGDRTWHIDTLCIGDIKKVMAWTKKYFKEKLGVGKTISWLRISDKGSVYRETTRTIKENW
jgi:hemolysin-activating ACP:hemolysin acyltransferase